MVLVPAIQVNKVRVDKKLPFSRVQRPQLTKYVPLTPSSQSTVSDSSVDPSTSPTPMPSSSLIQSPTPSSKDEVSFDMAELKSELDPIATTSK